MFLIFMITTWLAGQTVSLHCSILAEAGAALLGNKPFVVLTQRYLVSLSFLNYIKSTSPQHQFSAATLQDRSA